MYRKIASALVITLVSLCLTSIASSTPTMDNLLYVRYLPDDEGTAIRMVDLSSTDEQSFYVPTDASMYPLPLEWSPSGSVLAFALIDVRDHSVPSWWSPVQICTVTREGSHNVCMEKLAAPQANLWGEDRTRDAFPLSWSADERYIYYLTANVDDRYKVSLIKAAVETGASVEELATYTATPNEIPSVFWPRSLGAYILGGLSWNPHDSILINPSDETATHLRTIDNRIASICPRSSPDGKHFVAKSETGELIVYSYKVVAEAIISPVVEEKVYTPSCPTWSIDGRHLFFVGETAVNQDVTVFKYSLPEQQISVFGLVNDVQGGISDRAIEVSSRGDRVALTMVNYSTFESYVAVLDQSGFYQVMTGNNTNAANPLWIPDLFSNPTATPPPTIYRAIQNDHQVHIERALSAGIDTFDSPPHGDGWTLIGRTHGSGTDGTLMAFVVLDDVPYAAVQNARKGCIVITPESLEPVRHGATRKVEIVEEGVAACCAGDWSGFAP